MKHLRGIPFFVLFVYLIFQRTAPCSAQQAISLHQVLPPDSSIIVGKLDNGLAYYIKENKKPEKRAELRLVLRAGSVLEDDDQQGLAHFVEHMAFNGTRDFPKQDLINFLEKSGVRFGPELNAGTGFDETTYFLQVPTDSPAVMKTGFHILEQWAHEVTFNDTEIEKERGVIREEWRLGRGAEERVWRQHYPFVFYDSRYAERLPIGKLGVIDSCSHDVIRRFYRDWYRPDLMAVIAVGDFNKYEIEKLIKEDFSGLKDPAHERERADYPVPDHKATLVSIVTDKELSQASVDVLYLRDAHDTRTAGDYRNDLISGLYDRMFNERLNEMLVKPNPPFIYAYGGDGRFVAGKQVYSLGAGVADTSILSGLEALMREAYRVKEYGFTSSELDRQKTQLLRYMERAYEERDKTESSQFVSEYQRNFIYHEMIPGIATELEMCRQFLPGITLEEVNKLSTERMTEGNRVVIVSAPAKDISEIPTRAEILSVVNGAQTGKLEQYVDKVSSEPLIAVPPAPGKVVLERTIPSLGVTEWTLSNGVKVVLKPTDFRNDEVLFAAFSPGGSSLVDDSDYVSAVAAAAIISQLGIGNFNAIALRKKLTGKVVTVAPTIHDLSQELRGSSSSKDIKTMFELIYLYSTAPRRDTAAYSAYMTRWNEFLQNRSVDPRAVFNDTMRVTITNYHFRGRPFTSRLLKEVSLDKALEAYRNSFANFRDFTFFFVGNFQPDSLKPLVEDYIASLPSLDREEHWKDVGMRWPQGVIAKDIHKGIEPKSTVDLSFTGPFEWSEQNCYDFSAMIEVLNIKLREVLREDKGGTYGVSVSGSPVHYPRQEYSVSITWGCSPDRVDELVKQALIQVDSLKVVGPDSIDIEKVKEMDRRSYEVGLKQNYFWLWNLYSCYYDHEDPQTILQKPGLIDGLTGSAIQTAFRKYFKMDNYMKFVLYPEK